MSNLWFKTQKLLHAIALDTDGDHQQHAPSPILKYVGIGNSPCAYPGCEQYDHAFDDALDQAYQRQGSPRLLGPHAKLNGYESAIDIDTVNDYRRKSPKKNSLPNVFRHRGEDHILDGHHRITADRIEGRSTPVSFVDLDG